MNERRPLEALRDIALVGIGGALGTFARYSLSEAYGGTWLGAPGGSIWVTFSINVFGAFLLGLVVAVCTGRYPRAQLLLGTGVLGGFTTYSLFAADVAGLMVTGALLSALALGFGTVVFGGLGSLLGNAVGSALSRPRESGGAPGEGTP